MAVPKRKDVSPGEKKSAIKKYGNVTYADSVNKKYPLDTEEHVRAALTYWGMPKNRAKYSAEAQKTISAKIRAAAKKFGIKTTLSEVELGEKKLFEKQILRLGKWNHPNAPKGILEITKDFLLKIVDNFKKSPFAPIKRGHVKSSEAERNPNLIVSNNIKGLDLKDDGLYATMELDQQELEKYNDVSCEIDMDAEDHETGEKIGAALRGVALITDPYIKNLNPFIPLEEDNNVLINLSEITEMDEDNKKDEAELEETKEAESKEESPVEEPEVVKPEEEVSEEVKTEETKPDEEATDEPKAEDSEKKETVEASDLQKRIVELEEKLAKQESELIRTNAESKFNKLLKEGKITPAQKDTFIQLSMASDSIIELSDGKKSNVGELLNELFEKAPKLIEFEEQGVDKESTGEEEDKIKVALRERRSDLTEKEFEKLWEKYGNIAKEAVKS